MTDAESRSEIIYISAKRGEEVIHTDTYMCIWG